MEIIQFAVDSRNLPSTNGNSTLKIFNDTRRTSYGLLHHLGPLVRQQNFGGDVNISDFLNMAFLEEGDPSLHVDPMRAGFSADWLF